jgi:hypothetical protein
MHGESVFTVMVIPLNVPFLKPHNTDNILPVMSINAKESVELYQKAFAHLQDHLDLFRQGSFSVPAGEIEMSVPIEWALGLDLASVPEDLRGRVLHQQVGEHLLPLSGNQGDPRQHSCLRLQQGNWQVPPEAEG